MRSSHRDQRFDFLWAGLALYLWLAMGIAKSADVELPKTGPATESRFPPLVVPPGFQATLFACDPLVEYPSVLAVGPRLGTIYVAYDYMTGLGTEIIRRDEVRLVEDTDADGYADRSTLFAGGFNSIQGLAYHAGTIYVMHAPLLTALVDTDGDGAADDRRDLVAGLGLPPEQNPPRLHCANGVVVGHDGWLYLALGDHGCDVQRPEGDRLVLGGGGILRCRPDGRDLHVFATGLRNIYDIALDDELNVFVRDNENDGGNYMIRVCHSFPGADHGYPYLYDELPGEALAPLADLGRGSSAGGVCYLETAFPAEYRGSLFFCEWGRAVVHYSRQRAASTFAPMTEADFAAGAGTDPYGFKPTDVVVDRDGSLVISDWADGQRPVRGRGRIYRISYVGKHAAAEAMPPTTGPAGPGSSTRTPGEWIDRLDSESHLARIEAQEAIECRCRLPGGTSENVVVSTENQEEIEGADPDAIQALAQAIERRAVGIAGRRHAVWVLAHGKRASSIDALLRIAESDPDPGVRVQAIRAVADLADPVLAEHRLAAGRGDAAVAGRLAALAADQEPQVMLEIVVALGRLRWSELPRWLRGCWTKSDPALAHAAMQALRRSGNWPQVLALCDEPDDSPLRPVALRAVAGHADTAVVDGLIERLHHESRPQRRQEYAALLARAFKRPGPWQYWGYRPAPRPAGTQPWERTGAIEQALDRVLADADVQVRLATLRRMKREQVPVRPATLASWLDGQRDTETVDAVLDILRGAAADEARPVAARMVLGREYTDTARLEALAVLISGLDAASQHRLLEVSLALDDGPVRAELLRELGRWPELDAKGHLLAALNSPVAQVRAATMESLAQLRVAEAAGSIPRLLEDDDGDVRRAAALAAGELGVVGVVARLTRLAREAEPPVRAASLRSLRQLGEPNAVDAAVASLAVQETQQDALDYLADYGGPAHAAELVRLAGEYRSGEILQRVAGAISSWLDRQPLDSANQNELRAALAQVHGTSGVLWRWQVAGPMPPEQAAGLIEQIRQSPAPPGDLPGGIEWRAVLGTGADAQLSLGQAGDPAAGAVWLAQADVSLAEPTDVQFLAAANGALQVWVNGTGVFDRREAGAFRPDSDRFDASLVQGTNRLLVQVTSTSDESRFHLRFRDKSSDAQHERFAQSALQGGGDAARGRELFLNAEKSLCLKCHRLGNEGGRVGPELTGIGSRFSRIHLIESILTPGRTIAPSYETHVVALVSGQIVSGVKLAEDDATLTLGDNQGQTHAIAKSQIDEREVQTTSTMPDGVEKRLSPNEFVDLIEFLVSQQKAAGRHAPH